jgi:glutaconate CoA-transferase subunit B
VTSQVAGTSADYSVFELLACAVARDITEAGLGFIGLGTGGRGFTYAVGVPSVGIALAQYRGFDFIAQYGIVVDATIAEAPTVFSDPNLLSWRCRAMIPVETALDMFRRGMMDVGFISAAQIDQFGNTNTVVIGDHDRPTVRLVGGIAAPDHAAYARRVNILMPQSTRTFVKQLDYRSAVGHGDGPGFRGRLGLPGGGPARVYTDLAVLGFDPETLRMRVLTLHPGVSRDDVDSSTAFDLQWDKDVISTPKPTTEELELIRGAIDPHGTFLAGEVF